MLNVRAFSFQPWRFWRLVCVGASIHDSCDVIAKLLPDIAQSLLASAILHRIMEQRADCFGLIRAVSSAIAVTPRICATNGIPVFLRIWSPCARVASISASWNFSENFIQERNMESLLRMGLLEPFLIAVFECQIPILLVTRSVLLEILLGYHV